MKIPVYLKVFFLSFFCTALFSTAFLCAQNNQEIYPVGSDIYYALTALYLEQGLAPPSSSRPFSGNEMRKALDRIDERRLSSAGQKTYRYVKSQLEGRVLYGEKEGLAVNGSLEGNLEGYLHTNIDYTGWEYGYKERLPLLELPLEMWALDWFYANMVLTLKKDPFLVTEDPDNRSNFITDFAVVDVHFPYRAFLSAGGNHWNLRFGRDLYNWGNGYTGNLLLSDTLDYHDVLGFTTYWDNFKFSTLFLSLENWEEGNIREMDDVYKGFLGHRMEFRFLRRITISLFEGMMIGGKYSELRHLNPFMIYHNWMLNDRYSNIAFTMEANINPYRWINIYGQFLLDTVTSAFEKKEYPGSDKIPQANGYLFGAESKIPLGQGYLGLGIEFVHTDPWVYLMEGQPDYIVERRFLSNYLKSITLISKPLGYGYAPDANVFSLRAGYRVFGFFNLGAEARIIDKGEITADTPYRSDQEAAEMKTPSGVPQRKIVSHFHGGLNPVFLPWKFLAQMITFRTNLYWIHILNFKNVKGEILDDVQWTFSLSVKL
ncbi:MAG: hypothetical protein DRP87_10200 [Spirochaetes bacterium]|nr:MAG: hypothetical protein DRP87_10200 [Spirochaetota bacterium]